MRTTDSSSLHVKALHLVRQRVKTETATAIAAATDLPLGWLTAFIRGEIPSPSVHRVQIVWEYCMGGRLEVDRVSRRK